MRICENIMVDTVNIVDNVNLCSKKKNSGYTLIEMTIVLGVIIALIAVTLVGTQVYVDGARETSCIINQGTIHTAIVSRLNLREERLVPGVDYFLDPSIQEAFGTTPECPAVGGYTAIVDPDTGELVITCVEHGHGSSE